MILMDVKLNNIYGFTDFHMNFSYPKKIVNSIIESEWLSGHPNFRYKKAVILMGANAAGKTTLGKALLDHCRPCMVRLPMSAHRKSQRTATKGTAVVRQGKKDIARN